MFQQDKTPSQVLYIDGLEVHLRRKKVKNINLRVNREGLIHVSAHKLVDDNTIYQFVSANKHWILEQLKLREKKEPENALRYEQGETHFFWGDALMLNIKPALKIGLHLNDKEVLYYTKQAKPSMQEIEKAFDKKYRSMINRTLPDLLNHWCARVGVEVSECRIRKMKTKWGTCNISAARIWLSLELAKYPKSCLEYVLVHELTHLHERYHNRRFYRLLENYLPDWKQREALLKAPLSHE